MEKYLDWPRLIGLPVEIRQDGATITKGTVDAAMPNSSIVWLAPHGARHRTLFEAKQKYEVWVDPTAAAKNAAVRLALPKPVQVSTGVHGFTAAPTEPGNGHDKGLTDEKR